MENDMAELKAYVTKLRTDLTASNLVMLSIASALIPAQRREALRAIAEHSVQLEQTAEQTQKSEVIAPLQAAIQRLYSHLEGMHKLQASKGD